MVDKAVFAKPTVRLGPRCRRFGQGRDNVGLLAFKDHAYIQSTDLENQHSIFSKCWLKRILLNLWLVNNHESFFGSSVSKEHCPKLEFIKICLLGTINSFAK